MPSPFPGMDPYLEEEALWPAFQQQMILSLYQTLKASLADRYRGRVCHRRYCTRQALFTSVVDEEHGEDFLEVRQRGDNRLVALVEVVSPANKTTPEGRAAYLERRRESRAAGASLVEVDLVLQGQPTLDYSRDGLPDWDYAVTVTRGSQPDRYEVYTATLQKRLPRFRLPLGADDRDAVVDLHTAFSRCYDQGDFAARIDYRRDPRTRLDEDDRRWLHELLVQHKLR